VGTLDKARVGSVSVAGQAVRAAVSAERVAVCRVVVYPVALAADSEAQSLATLAAQPAV
jgi:hypothetical protein